MEENNINIQQIKEKIKQLKIDIIEKEEELEKLLQTLDELNNE